MRANSQYWLGPHTRCKAVVPLQRGLHRDQQKLGETNSIVCASHRHLCRTVPSCQTSALMQTLWSSRLSPRRALDGIRLADRTLRKRSPPQRRVGRAGVSVSGCLSLWSLPAGPRLGHRGEANRHCSTRVAGAMQRPFFLPSSILQMCVIDAQWSI